MTLSSAWHDGYFHACLQQACGEGTARQGMNAAPCGAQPARWDGAIDKCAAPVALAQRLLLACALAWEEPVLFLEHLRSNSQLV